MNGRDKCDLLNQIRQRIADANDIEFTIYDCTFEGDCTGTCPKCESEREYLEKELERKQNAGEKINLKNIFVLDDECTAEKIDYPTNIPSDIMGDIPPRHYDRPVKGDLISDKELEPLQGMIIPSNYDKNERD